MNLIFSLFMISASADPSTCGQYYHSKTFNLSADPVIGGALGCKLDPCCDYNPLPNGRLWKMVDGRLERNHPFTCTVNTQNLGCDANLKKAKKKKEALSSTCAECSQSLANKIAMVENEELNIDSKALGRNQKIRLFESHCKDLEIEAKELEQLSGPKFNSHVLDVKGDDVIGIYVDRGALMAEGACEPLKQSGATDDIPCLYFAIEAAKNQLASLSPKQKFNVFFTSEHFKSFGDQPVFATPENKKAAEAFLDKYNHPGFFNTGTKLKKALKKTVEQQKLSTAVVFGSGDFFEYGDITSLGTKKSTIKKIGKLHEESEAMCRDFRIVFHPYEFKKKPGETGGTNWEVMDKITDNLVDAVVDEKHIEAKKEELKKASEGKFAEAKECREQLEEFKKKK